MPDQSAGFPAYAFVPPPELRGERRRHPVAIVGAGPVGLTVAHGLARYGVECVVLDARGGVEYGSRAICISRRSLELWEKLGLASPVLEAALPWTSGRSFWRGHQVLQFAMPSDPGQKHPPMVNLQQSQAEQMLIDSLPATPGFDLRWHSRAAGLRTGPDGIELDIETPDGPYTLHADHLVAADGARSLVRQALGLRLEGDAYQSRYLIADIRVPVPAETERRVWFDPPSNPGSTVVMHRQPGNVWRVDYQLRPDEDEAVERQEARVKQRIAAHLAMLGDSPEFELVWTSMYRAYCLSLQSFRHGRVLFAGDAAHLVPIFGVRGLNSGIDDAVNLAWKLAALHRGWAGDGLLDSYSTERVFAAQENIRQARKSTLFMTPPTKGHELLRDAALSLASTSPLTRPLINPRQTTAIPLPGSPAASGARPPAGPAVGSILPDLRVTVLRAGQAGPAYLLDTLGLQPTVLLRAGDEAADAWLAGVSADPFRPLAVLPLLQSAQAAPQPAVLDRDGGIAAVLGLDAPGSGLLVRPDLYVAARWSRFDPATMQSAIDRLWHGTH